MNTGHYNLPFHRYSEESYYVAQRLRSINMLAVCVIIQLAMPTSIIIAFLFDSSSGV